MSAFLLSRPFESHVGHEAYEDVSHNNNESYFQRAPPVRTVRLGEPPSAFLAPQWTWPEPRLHHNTFPTAGKAFCTHPCGHCSTFPTPKIPATLHYQPINSPPHCTLPDCSPPSLTRPINYISNLQFGARGRVLACIFHAHYSVPLGKPPPSEDNCLYLRSSRSNLQHSLCPGASSCAPANTEEPSCIELLLCGKKKRVCCSRD